MHNKNWQKLFKVWGNILDWSQGKYFVLIISKVIDFPYNKSFAKFSKSWQVFCEWVFCTTPEEANPPREPLPLRDLWTTDTFLIHTNTLFLK